uniref:Uncharacterized protein n=1 Tax=Oryza glumipatula TaxID=40148 RepID=A0A0E0B8P1_9ORYZ
MFCVVSVLFTTILDSLLLGHDLSVGRNDNNGSILLCEIICKCYVLVRDFILGMLLILAGLYLFLWGKRKEVVPETTETQGGGAISDR